MNKNVYNLLQWTWCIPQNLLGAGLVLIHRKDPHFSYRGARVTEWSRQDGISLGRFIFIPARRATGSHRIGKHGYADKTKSHGKPTDTGRSGRDFLLEHEYGHSIQSLMLGPFYLLLVGLPSMAWNRLPYFARQRKKTGKSYYSAIFERTATTLGARTAHRQR